MDTVIIQSDQIDLICSVIFVCTMSVCFCIGWLCHETGGK